MSFKMAGSLGFKEAAAKARPVLLEPISELVITVPEAYQGDVMGDLNSKRGRIQGTAAVGNGEQEISALVPTSEVIRYAIDLRSLTGGRGRFTATHSHYDPAPPNLADKIVAEARRPRRADRLRDAGSRPSPGRRRWRWPWRRPVLWLNGAKWSPSRVKMSAPRASASSYCFSGRTIWSVVVTTTAQGTSTSGASGRPS